MIIRATWLYGLLAGPWSSKALDDHSSNPVWLLLLSFATVGLRRYLSCGALGRCIVWLCRGGCHLLASWALLGQSLSVAVQFFLQFFVSWFGTFRWDKM